METKRIYLWDNLKVVLMMFVVMTHCVVPYQLTGNGGSWLQPYWVMIMTFTMPLFTMISGFWYKERPLKQILLKLGVPMLIFTVWHDVLLVAVGGVIMIG